MHKRMLSEEELKAKVEAVDRLLQSDPSLSKIEACERVGGISRTTYHTRGKKYSTQIKSRVSRSRLKSEPTYQKVILPPKTSGFELRGSPEEIARFVRELSKGNS